MPGHLYQQFDRAPVTSFLNLHVKEVQFVAIRVAEVSGIEF